MTVLIPPAVAKQMQPMPKRDAMRMLEALETVAGDLTRRLPFVTEIKGRAGVWRLRKGDWRAIYVIVEGDVLVVRVAHRKEVYE